MEKTVMKIDVDGVLARRAPSLPAFVRRPLTSLLARIIRQKDLNRMLLKNAHRSGADFCAGVLEDLHVTYGVDRPERLPEVADRVIYVSNHPLGALDGICLIDMVARLHPGRRVSFVVNDLLMAIGPLEEVFVPVNKHGGQSRSSAASLDEALSGDGPVIIFPAGLCSRRIDGRIADLEWRKMFVGKARESRRDIIPLRFHGQNSSFFYTFAKMRQRSGIKFNVEMTLLPREIFNCRDRRFDISVGERIPWETLEAGAAAQSTARRIRALVDAMAKPKK